MTQQPLDGFSPTTHPALVRYDAARSLPDRISDRTTMVAGSFWSFVVALFVVAIWALTGPVFGFSNTWQLIINTSTTIVTFEMTFIIQNSQNRSALRDRDLASHDHELLTQNTDHTVYTRTRTEELVSLVQAIHTAVVKEGTA